MMTKAQVLEDWQIVEASLFEHLGLTASVCGLAPVLRWNVTAKLYHSIQALDQVTCLLCLRKTLADPNLGEFFVEPLKARIKELGG